MFNKLTVIVLAAAAMVLMPSMVDAYGAAHVGYTHVGPNGVQHYGATEVRTPYGAAGGAHYSAYGAQGGAYHADTYRAGYGAAYGGSSGYHYSGTTAAGGSYNYAYVR
jgi:hypothetical protein